VGLRVQAAFLVDNNRVRDRFLVPKLSFFHSNPYRKESFQEQIMKLSEHAEHTQRVVGVRAEDIHKWIDGFFDRAGFDQHLASGQLPPDFDPYAHRRHRHCKEALEEAYQEFEGKYTREQIKGVFETHIRDDYNGYIPTREDFEDGTFNDKYHERDDSSREERILSKEELSEYFSGKAHRQLQKQREGILTGFKLRIVLPTAMAVVVFIVSILVVIVPLFRENMLAQKRLMIKELTAAASSIVLQYADRVKQGEISLEEAQTRAVDEVRAMRYGIDNKDYFWITDMHPRMVMHPYREELTGMDLSEYRDAEDASGVLLFVESLNLVRQNNEGYLKYLWQWMDDPGKSVLKLSYVRGIPEWGWIIGTGIYLDDVEKEMSKLGHQLFVTFFYITLALLAFLLYIIHQSRRIENRRQKAEAGLIEAKERYRALVESSNEGYFLEVDGAHVYCNHTLQRLLGYDEVDLLDKHIWQRLLVDHEQNREAIRNISHLLHGKTTQGEFPAQVRHHNGSLLDVMIRTSRIFLSQKNGHVIALRPITRRKILLPKDIPVDSKSENREHHPSVTRSDELLGNIDASTSIGLVISALNRLPSVLTAFLKEGEPAGAMRELVSQAYDKTLRKAVLFSLQEVGDPPCRFAMLSLGSNARGEMTLFSDQDNAVVFEPTASVSCEAARSYFLILADRVCRRLDQAGYPYCEGGVMASNPRWCLSVKEWMENLSSWMTDPSAESLMEMNIAFDIHCALGDQELVDVLVQHIQHTLDANPAFLTHYARNCLTLKTPGLLAGRLKSSNPGKNVSINLKECILPIVMFARLYTHRHGLPERTTIERILAMENSGILQPQSAQDLKEAFDYLWQLRFRTQIRAYEDLRHVHEELDAASLTAEERESLRSVLSKIAHYQNRIPLDFPGSDQW
jgi:CBS domain-containing protein